MRVTVDVRTPDGEVVALGHGAIIGRLWSADLMINDARVSEAHAMVSLRGRDVRLLALRGRFAVRGTTLSSVVLAPGMVVSLATGLELEILAVRVPDAVLALEADGVARQVLTGVTSLYGGPRPRLVAGWQADADDYVWPTGTDWMRGSDHPREVRAGDGWQVGGTTFRASELRAEGAQATVIEQDYATPLTITARFDTVHIARKGEAVVVITGIMARVISELVSTGAALSWDSLAEDLWGDAHRDVLRRRWDAQLMRLRRKLRDHGLRADLLRADGSGLIELVVGLDDVLIDET